MSEPDYSILIGADGEEGLIDLIKMIRFDTTIQVYMVPVLITDESFEVNKSDNPEDGTTKYEYVREVSIRQGSRCYKTQVFYSDESNRYYISVARVAPYLQDRTRRFLEHNINGKYGNYFLDVVDGRPLLLKGLSR